MENLKNFREGLFASASHLSADQVSLFEPFVVMAILSMPTFSS
jgi:hypothetical protein